MTDTQYRLYFTHREEGWPEYLTWTPFDDSVQQPIQNHVVKPDLLPSEEVLQILEEYCRTKGIPVPKEDYDACMEEIHKEREARDNPTEPEYTPAPPSAPVRPEYGTPDYWKWWWKTKPERDAKKKAEQDAKDAKQKERDAKKAEKEAEQKRKALEKIAKAEAKAEKEAKKANKKSQ